MTDLPDNSSQKKRARKGKDSQHWDGGTTESHKNTLVIYVELLMKETRIVSSSDPKMFLD